MEFFACALERADSRLREIERQRESAEEDGVLGEQLPVLREFFNEVMGVVDILLAVAREVGIPAEDLSLLGAV